MCDEHGIGGSGEYFGNNDAHLGRVSMFYCEAFGSKYDAGHLVNHMRGKKLGQRPLQKDCAPFFSDPPHVV
jgi:hypothetical protein